MTCGTLYTYIVQKIGYFYNNRIFILNIIIVLAKILAICVM